MIELLVIATAGYFAGNYAKHVDKGYINDSSDVAARDPKYWDKTRPRYPDGTIVRKKDGSLADLE